MINIRIALLLRAFALEASGLFTALIDGAVTTTEAGTLLDYLQAEINIVENIMQSARER